jgi:hypothetical protein
MYFIEDFSSGKLVYNFLFWLYSSLVFGIRVILSSQNEFGGISSLSAL